MLFNSYIFVFLFLPLCILGYFGLNHFKKYRLAKFFLLGMSLWFYGYYNVTYLLILSISVLLNYGVYLILGRVRGGKSARLVMVFGVVLNVGILIYFKYMDFLIGNINGIFKTDVDFLRIALPLGISFFTFQQISFVVDAYRGEVPGYDFLRYACFVTFFPQLIAGPIVTHDELVPQFEDMEKKRINSENLAKGLYIFAMGLAKKVLLADTFGKLVTYGYNMVDSLNTLSALLVILAYTIQIYFDFSGYCDMAIGIGKMLNIDLPVNFHSPYKALTIVDFWNRWHITLTRFFTKYVYIPLGGSRKGNSRTYLNVLVVFLISGFWHGANWTFVFWGLIHGVFNVITRMCRCFFDKLPKDLNWLITFVFVNVAWVFFRADSFGQAIKILKRAVAMDFSGMDKYLAEQVVSIEFAEVMDVLGLVEKAPQLVLAGFFVAAFVILFGFSNAHEKMERFRPTLMRLGSTLVLLLWSIFSFAGISTFLYFNF